ncbi:unnamed protein product, partial [Prorocentrum cordatum]
ARPGAAPPAPDSSRAGPPAPPRSPSRPGAPPPPLGRARPGPLASALGTTRAGAPPPPRSPARTGSPPPAPDPANPGSPPSARSHARLGSTLQIYGGKLSFNSADTTYMQETSSEMFLYVQGAKTLTLSSTGGQLHGVWSSENSVTVSDRRLKTNIKPLMNTLRQNRAAAISRGEVPAEPGVAQGLEPQGVPEAAEDNPTGTPPGTLRWLLRSLRPVSYNFKQGADAKQVRFGFIAQDVERVLPQVVHDINQTTEKVDGQEPRKGIAYPDLIAVMTAMMKDFSSELHGVRARLEAAEAELDRLDREDPMDLGPL